MSKVKITSDSISDLDYLFAERGIARLPIPILLGDREGLDGEITPDDIYAFFDETKATPKTSAITPPATPPAAARSRKKEGRENKNSNTIFCIRFCTARRSSCIFC